MLKNLKYNIGYAISKCILPNGLYCFNYHRIGDINSSQYDPNVFSCDENNFAEHINYIKKNFTIIKLEDVASIINNNLNQQKYALITFDDGYIDNYSSAFPILQKAKIPATFFLATDFINDAVIPWWDKIAYLVRNAQVNEVKLTGWKSSITLCKADISKSIRKVLNAVKVNKNQKIDDVLLELQDKLQIIVAEHLNESPLFMTWDMIREMNEAGMDFGSQTCSHRIMSHLNSEDQNLEAKLSKQVIEKEIGCQIKAFAYPVGGKNSFTEETVEVIKKYYDLSFSFISGINTSSKLNKFSIKRISIDNNITVPQLAYRLLKLQIKKIKSRK